MATAERLLFNEPFSPDEMVSELNALGCPVTVEIYRSLLLAIGTCTHQGTHDRGPEKDATGQFRIPIDATSGTPLQEDNPYDRLEMRCKRLLRTSLEKHLHLCWAGNRWPSDFNPPVSIPIDFPSQSAIRRGSADIRTKDVPADSKDGGN